MQARQMKSLRAIGHHLNPVVTVGDAGISDGVAAELERALGDHELIKLKVNIGDRLERRRVIEALVAAASAEVVQLIGKVALVYRANPKARPELSNVARHSSA